MGLMEIREGKQLKFLPLILLIFMLENFNPLMNLFLAGCQGSKPIFRWITHLDFYL